MFIFEIRKIKRAEDNAVNAEFLKAFWIFLPIAVIIVFLEIRLQFV